MIVVATEAAVPITISIMPICSNAKVLYQYSMGILTQDAWQSKQHLLTVMSEYGAISGSWDTHPQGRGRSDPLGCPRLGHHLRITDIRCLTFEQVAEDQLRRFDRDRHLRIGCAGC